MGLVSSVNKPESSTLETSEEDQLPLLPHQYEAESEPILAELKVRTTLETSGEVVKPHSKRVEKL